METRQFRVKPKLMPFLSCPDCRRTHYGPDTSRASTCPSCSERRGQPVRLFATETLKDARRRLTATARGEPRRPAAG